MAFKQIDVTIKFENGPTPADRIISSGRITKFTIKIPNGGIHTLLKTTERSIVLSHTYCIDVLHTPVRIAESVGRRIHTKRENAKFVRDGNHITSPNVIRVISTA